MTFNGCLFVLSNSSSIPIDADSFSLGRSKKCNFQLTPATGSSAGKATRLSNKHVEISKQGEQFLLTDLSKNGVWINDKQIG